jgi:adenine phosphoribosyltransferase
MASADARLAGIASSIRVIPDFPKPGGFTPDFRTIVPHLTSPSVSTTLLLYRSRGWTTGRWMSGRE